LTYKDGCKNGLEKEYHANGNIKLSKEFKDDKLFK
jgi:antitoxin component YwqK of YwqJK toxin-antitoxin module